MKHVKKAVKYSAKSAKAKIKQGVKKIAPINKEEAKKLLEAFIAELKVEAKRFETFAKKELVREVSKVGKKAKPLLNKTMKRAHKALRR